MGISLSELFLNVTFALMRNNFKTFLTNFEEFTDNANELAIVKIRQLAQNSLIRVHGLREIEYLKYIGLADDECLDHFVVYNQKNKFSSR